MKGRPTGWAKALALAAIALLAYGALTLWTHVKSIPDEAQVRAQPVLSNAMLQTLARGLACEALFPGVVEDRQQPFTRWREYHRVALRAAEADPLRLEVERQVDAQKARFANATVSEREKMEFDCRFAAFEVPTAPVQRAMEVLATYDVCVEMAPGFDRDHAGDLREWKRRNEKGVDAITCRQFGRDGTNGNKDYIRQLNTLRERELYRLRNGPRQALDEQVAFCRTTVVRWLRSGA